jgi:hypothetical protein
MPLHPRRLETLLDVAAQIEFRACKADDPFQAGLHLRRDIASSHESFRLFADRIERLHEVPVLQLSSVVGHGSVGCRVLRSRPVGVSGGRKPRWLCAWKLWNRPALADLLAPHCIVESCSLEQVFVLAGLDDLSALQNVNAVRMHYRR